MSGAIILKKEYTTKMMATETVIVNINLSHPRLVIFETEVEPPATSSAGGCKRTKPITDKEIMI